MRTSLTSVGGSFEFASLLPGTYTLRASPNPSPSASLAGLLGPLAIVEHAINVRFDEQAAALGLLVVATSDPTTETYVVLRYLEVQSATPSCRS